MPLSLSLTIGPAMIVGLCLGSFAGAASWRLPRGRSVTVERSRCPTCGHPLGAADLVPVVSWLLSKGRCRHCGGAISARYPLIEAATALLVAAAWAHWSADPIAAGCAAVVATACMVIVATDIETMRIPDAATLALAAAGLGFRLSLGGDTGQAVLGAATFGGIAFAIRWIYRKWHGRHGLGLGDVKMMAAAGLALGPAAIGPFLILSGALSAPFGLAWRSRRKEPAYPFGPALAAALLVLLWVTPGWR